MKAVINARILPTANVKNPSKVKSANVLLLPKRTASQFCATTSTEHFLLKRTTIPNFRI